MSKRTEQPELVPQDAAGGAREQEQAVAVRGGDSAYALILAAVADKACDPQKLRELLAVRREWRADEAAAAFNAAVVRFQQECPIIAKDDSANGRPYARMDRIWRVIRPLMERCGLAVTWERVEIKGDVCELAGHLRHRDGHAQPLAHAIPLPTAIPGQNAAQRAGSGETYAKRYATCAALGVQTGDDDDGMGGAGGATVTAAELHQLRRECERTGTDEAKLCAWVGCATLEDFPQARHAEAMAQLRRKGDK